VWINIIPTIPLDAKNDMEVQFAFENASSGIIYYLEGHKPKTVANLHLPLFRDGQLVESETPLPPELAKERVRALKAGDSLIYTIKLRDEYGDLKPGHYVLRAKYSIQKGSVPHKEYGITPWEIDQIVAHLEIR
jgi:hypothetical protein